MSVVAAATAALEELRILRVAPDTSTRLEFTTYPMMGFGT
jgi:hypothetical protein